MMPAVRIKSEKVRQDIADPEMQGPVRSVPDVCEYL